MRLISGLSPTVRRLSSTAPQNNDSQYRFQTLAVSTPHEFVKHVELNRPEKRNAMNATFFRLASYHLGNRLF